MSIVLSAYKWVPPFAQGYVKDLRVRWALEEAGLPYEVRLIDGRDQASESYRRWQPFGQVPAYRDDEVEMFESGAIVLHLAARSAALAEPSAAGLARASTWVLAALNSIEPFAQDLIRVVDAPPGEPWQAQRRPQVEAQLNRRLAALDGWLGDKDWLEGRFTAGDLVMTTVLRELVDSGALAAFPTLDAYRRRGEARPAFGRAMEGQLQAFRDNAPAA
ncbi:MAG: glutathione S-transferase family protein [Proteobacteria bacterium]|nr:glutathione S-transferase family protein [Pseudomonadota bacterium]